MATPTPFTLHVPDADIEDLRRRLASTRYPDAPPDAGWKYGCNLEWLRGLVDYWRGDFDWRAQEARLNAFPQFKVPIAGIDLHYLRVEGKGPSPMPLLLSHGWPGSVFEFLDLIPRLTDPARFGGDERDAFTVVVPSLPGYGLSFEPMQPRFSIEQIADCFAELMTDVLGYSRFAAQGGDWGSSISARLAFAHPDKMIGVHLNMMPVQRDPKDVGESPTPEEARYQQELKAWLKDGIGYSTEQGTKPQTLAYGLTDSPAGLAAWIAEKFQGWSDCGGDVDSVFSRDEILADVGLYWFTGAIGSSFWPYYARAHGPWPVPAGSKVDVPIGYCEFPAEIVRPPRSLAEKTYTNIQRWSVMPRGGHFAALEQPEALAAEVQAFFRPLRD